MSRIKYVSGQYISLFGYGCHGCLYNSQLKLVSRRTTRVTYTLSIQTVFTFYMVAALTTENKIMCIILFMMDSMLCNHEYLKAPFYIRYTYSLSFIYLYGIILCIVSSQFIVTDITKLSRQWTEKLILIVRRNTSTRLF